MLGEDFRVRLNSDRESSRILLKHFFEVEEVCLSSGGHISFEWPRHNSGWLLPELITFITKHGLFEALVDGCACGMINAKKQPLLPGDLLRR